MTVKEFLQNYGGNEYVSIEGYCKEAYFDCFRESDECNRSDGNPDHYKLRCISEEPWWNEVKNRKIKEWTILGGVVYEVVLCIYLAEN